MKVEWEEAKNLANRRKHGLDFEEAAQAFTTTSDSVEIFDQGHSDEEDRFLAIGPIPRGLVVVVWAARDEKVRRNLSAR